MYLPVYAGVIEEIKCISLRVPGPVVDDSVDYFPLRYTCLKQRIIYCHRYAIFTPVDQIGRYLRFKR